MHCSENAIGKHVTERWSTYESDSNYLQGYIYKKHVGPGI